LSSYYDFTDFNRPDHDTSGLVLIDDWDVATGSGSTFIFSDPIQIISATSFPELNTALTAISDLQAQGYYLAGYLSYDAGLMLDAPISTRHTQNVPLLWLGVYNTVLKTDYADACIPTYEETELITDEHLNISDEEYLASVTRIKEYIAAGDVYQVNYTCKLLFRNAGTAMGLFSRLRRAHPVCHSAYINTGNFQVISLSPELFMRRTGDRLQTRPMKGTTKRGLSYEEDIISGQFLQQDVKNRAENVMIVDLMRNDIGRVCKYGSVSVPEIFQIESYRSLLQMTSEVEGTLKDGISSCDILESVLPAGSITGAPKIRSMQIIDQLESTSRGVYCGSIGMFQPGGDFLLNVAIRTIIQRGETCEMGIGSGIVADSDPHSELKETLLKGSFLKMTPVDFQLLETFAYQKDRGYLFLDEHLTRMQNSAAYFGWKFDQPCIRKSLINMAEEHIEHELQSKCARVRLLVSISGELHIEWASLDSVAITPIKLLLAKRQTNSDDVFLYHKTTKRELYDQDLHQVRKAGYFDVLYTNQRDELTECSITNILIEIDSKWYTPPIACGLLPGIWRQNAIAQGRVTERIITHDDLSSATRVAICNSVRGEIEVTSIEVDAESAAKLVWQSQNPPV
jgi:para-aminobenzoate synthetase/4-amino-4-deoxychorismate lyase